MCIHFTVVLEIISINLVVFNNPAPLMLHYLVLKLDTFFNLYLLETSHLLVVV